MHLAKGAASNENIVKKHYKQSLKELLPYGMLATKKWLAKQGLSAHSLDNAVKTQTLLPLAKGVYSQYCRSISWQGVIASVQFMEKCGDEQVPSVLVGGLSALTLSGLSQYLSLGNKPHVHLYTAGKLPAWMARLSLPVKFDGHNTNKIWPESLSKDNAFLKEHMWEEKLPPVYFSCPEKAILELLVDLPKSVTFEHADELMQGLVNLSPRKLDILLKACKSVKAKRLFLWLAERQSYSWFQKLDIDEYDLGSGKRVVAKGGKLDTQYLITVPANMMLENKGSAYG